MKRHLIMALMTMFAFSLKSSVEAEEDAADIANREYLKSYSGKYLYTKPDPSVGGGIQGEIIKPSIPVVGVFALPPDYPHFCYRAQLGMSASNTPTFSFTGLPAGKYDLFILYKLEIYEGLTLSRYKTTLTPKDHKLIDYIVQKSEPFFGDGKTIHRICGQTGKMKGKAKAIVSMVCKQCMSIPFGGFTVSTPRRALKVFYLEDVGPGWQVAETREIMAVFTMPGKEVPKANYRPYLGKIRVVDIVKDLGKLDLSKPGEKQAPLPEAKEDIDTGASVAVEDDDRKPDDGSSTADGGTQEPIAETPEKK